MNTIILMTACGCQRQYDWPCDDRFINMPLFDVDNYRPIHKKERATFQISRVRTFEWRGEYLGSCRIYREKLTG